MTDRVLLAVCGALLAAIGLVSGCRSSSASIPVNCYGSYETMHEDYANRGFTLTPTQLKIDTGESIQSYPVVAVDATSEEQDQLYTVIHLNEAGQEYHFRFFCDEARQRITMRERPEVAWIKTAQR